jgi:hypothetical protein
MRPTMRAAVLRRGKRSVEIYDWRADYVLLFRVKLGKIQRVDLEVSKLWHDLLGEKP